MPRPIWRGAISFGMVAIPVKLYTATESKDVSFRQLHKEDHSRVKQLRWNPNLDKEVPYDEIVRGYEYSKDRYVILDDEDFDNLPLPSKRSVQIKAFVKLEEIDPVFYERSYYLEPDEAGVKPFALLLKALEEKGLTAVAQVAIRNKERLCSLRPGAEGRNAPPGSSPGRPRRRGSKVSAGGSSNPGRTSSRRRRNRSRCSSMVPAIISRSSGVYRRPASFSASAKVATPTGVSPPAGPEGDTPARAVAPVAVTAPVAARN